MDEQGGHGDPAAVAVVDRVDTADGRRFVVDGDGAVSEDFPGDLVDVEIFAASLKTAAEIVELVCRRHQKYGPLNIAASPGGPLNGLRVRLFDKLARLNHAIDAGEHVDYDDDSFRDCFADIVGYGLIGLLVLDGEWPGA